MAIWPLVLKHWNLKQMNYSSRRPNPLVLGGRPAMSVCCVWCPSLSASCFLLYMFVCVCVWRHSRFSATSSQRVFPALEPDTCRAIILTCCWSTNRALLNRVAELQTTLDLWETQPVFQLEGKSVLRWPVMWIVLTAVKIQVTVFQKTLFSSLLWGVVCRILMWKWI